MLRYPSLFKPPLLVPILLPKFEREAIESELGLGSRHMVFRDVS
ncbi:MAG: hypothetical protein ABI147_02240 [Acidobacteriaceae bacterium]